MKRNKIINFLKVTVLSLFCFGLGRAYEAKNRIPEEAENIMAAYQAGKSECNK